jgi:hypothetical protein
MPEFYVRSPSYPQRVNLKSAAEPDQDVARGLAVAWQLAQFTRAHVTSMEEQATRVVAAQVAGLIALWTQLGNFDGDAARILAWASWVTLILSITSLGPVVTPRRIARFWEHLPLPTRGKTTVHPLTAGEEARIVAQLATTTEEQAARIGRGLRVSIFLGLLALGLVSLAYVLEKTL